MSAAAHDLLFGTLADPTRRAIFERLDARDDLLKRMDQ